MTETQSTPRTSGWWVPAMVLLACHAGSTATSDASTGTEPPPTSVTLEPPPTTSDTVPTTTIATSTSATETDSDSEDDPPPTYCHDLDISLVAHPGIDIYKPEHRAAFAKFMAEMVETTAARVRLLATAGSEMTLKTECLAPLGNSADDPVLVYGEGGVVDPQAPEALDCLLTAISNYKSDFDKGDHYFSGLLFPVLELPHWPAPGATNLALMLTLGNDEQNNMYAQPGMAAEGYLRLAGASDRRRVAALSFGKQASELEIFGHALSEHSRHFERGLFEISDALKAWTPAALQVCDDFDFEPPFQEDPPPGCQRIDVLFTIDGSGSMFGEQDALRGANGEPPVFAEFTEALLNQLTDVEDFHVGVVSTEPEVTTLHTHTNFPAVPASPETACGVPEGQRWLVGPSDTFAEQFACIAATRAGDYEVTAYNTVEALHDPANAGFLRDDSLVFVVILTDEDSGDASLATTVEIRERLLEAVGGDLRRLVVLLVAGGQGVFEAPKTTCHGPYGSAAPGRRLLSIVYSLRERGLFQNLCEGDMTSTFASVLDDVVSACKMYGPVP